MNILRKSMVSSLAKILFLLPLFFSNSYGCAACMLMTPSVEVDVQMNIKEKKLNHIYFAWNFSKDFTTTIMGQYDKNRDKKLDKKELDNLHQAFLDYLRPKNMLTTIEYADQNASEPTQLHPKYDNFEITKVNDLFVVTYNATLKKEIFNGADLSITLMDNNNFFTFRIRKLHINKCNFAYSKNLYLFTASMLFTEKSMIDKTQSLKTVQTIEKKTTEASKQEKEKVQDSLLKRSMEKVKSLFESIKDEKNPITYLSLLLFAYLYGVIHAMGPGHGKTLVASYFLSNERSYLKALFISLAIGIVHTFSAFILTVVIYFVLNTLLAQFLGDTVYYTTKISALIIISIAIYLIYTKYLAYKAIKKEQEAAKKAPKFTFSASPAHISTCGCASCKVDKDSTDIALIISAGIIPCPGTTTLFIFALSTGLYYAGFISALVMSLGMSSVIFVSALLSTIVRKKVLKSNDTLKQYLEFGSLAIILVLGAVLLFA